MSDVAALVDRWRRRAERDDPADAWAEGYNAALDTCADELAARLEVPADE